MPAPARSRVAELDLQPGGAFESLISEDGGDFVPHVRFCFLAVDDQRRLVFTDALTPGWRPAEAGDEVILTRHGHPAVRFVAMREVPDRQSGRALLDAVRRSAKGKATSGPGAARSRNFLYGDDGIPE